MNNDYPNEQDYWEAQNELDRSIYKTSLEEIYEKIEKIINDPGFGIFGNYDETKNVCSLCYARTEVNKELIHGDGCRVIKLRSLVATLRDMIS